MVKLKKKKKKKKKKIFFKFKKKKNLKILKIQKKGFYLQLTPLKALKFYFSKKSTI
jgi:hypothetical protein